MVRWKPARLGVLLAASLIFYAVWSPFPLLVFGWCAGVDHLCIRGMERTQGRLRKALMLVSVVSNLAILGTFKYADMFYATAASILGAVGIQVRYAPLGLVLPVGLSFVAFQAISLTVDYYRGEIKRRFGFFEHFLYLLFFPQVVAGPIVRASDLLERFDNPPQLDPRAGAAGIYRIALGVAKKLLIADILAVGLVDRVFEAPERFSSLECALGVVGYTFQLYNDFSAYSDIAIGAAALFGFSIPENFDKPYLAKNLFEFWNRWHISLSSWLRDYLYIPLGGNRCARPRVLFNLFMVMALGGLWHGADWRFALWGAVHGAGLIVIRLWWWALGGRPKKIGLLRTGVGIAATFTIVVVTRIIFRAPDLGAAQAMVEHLAKGSVGYGLLTPMVLAALAAAIVGHLLPHRASHAAAAAFAWMPAPARAAALVALGLLIRQAAMVEVRPYIYFQF